MNAFVTDNYWNKNQTIDLWEIDFMAISHTKIWADIKEKELLVYIED